MRAYRVLVGIPLLVCLACASGPRAAGADPNVTVKAWRDAVARDDPHAAWALLSPEMQKQMPYPEFERRWKSSRAERERQATALGAESEATGASAEISMDDGKKTTLRRENGFWRFQTPLVASSRATTPQEALRLFATAIEDRNFFAVMRLLTGQRKDGINGFLDGFVGGLRNQASAEIVMTDNRAVIEWKDGAKTWRVTLIKQPDGEWLVDDVDVF
jgi:hypothetical protein